MTGSNTDAVSTAPFERASAIILTLTGPLCHAWIHGDKVDPLDRCYNAWFALRGIAAKFTERRSTEITREERERLCGALDQAHSLAHDTDPGDAPTIDVCHCGVSESVRDLIFLLSEAR